MALPAKKIEHRTEAHAKADELLRSIKEEQEKLAALNGKYSEQAQLLVQIYKVAIKQKKAYLELLEKRLKKLCKANRDDFFSKTDRVDLNYGALLFAVEKSVKRAREVLARLEEIGAAEAVIITKSVNWDVLEDWTDERLIEVGTERKRTERYSYEIFGGKK
jgi:phage host-nuclease inhibitor protein Gam